MKVHQMLICIFILSLQDGNTGLINAQIITGNKGGNITYGCSFSFSFSGSRKIFCKEECEEKDILVETTGDRAQRGRYSIEWKKSAYTFTSLVLYVSITNLTKSDSGRYTCRLVRNFFPDSNEEFEIRVKDAPITEPTRSLPSSPPSVKSTSTPTTTQSSNVVPGTLQDGNTGLINAQIITGNEGGNIIYACSFSFFSGSRTIFCKEQCEEKDILVETTGDRAERGRYSIEWKKPADRFTPSVLYVSITNLTKSDSGLYTCRLDRGILANKEFEIRVKDAPITEPNRPLPHSPPSVKSTSTPTTTQSLNVVPRGSTPSSASTDTSSQSGPRQRTAGPATGVQLYVRLTLVVIFIVSAAAVVIFFRRRASKAEDPPVEAEYVNVTEANPVHEELREDRQSRSPLVGISAGHNLSCSQFAEDSV